MLENRQLWLAAAIFVLYSSTAFQTIPGGDSGELVAAACEGSTAHPPGYPLFTLLAGMVMKLLPLGRPVWRVNMMVSAFGAFAAVFVGDWSERTVRMLHRSSRKDNSVNLPLVQACGTLATVLYATNPLVWTYSHGAEVFALNNLLCAMIASQLLRWCEEPTRENLLIGVFLSGLGMSNQHTSSLTILPAALFIVGCLVWEKKLTVGMSVEAIGIGLAGMLPYVYLPLSAIFRGRTPGSWGYFLNWGGLARHFFRTEYGTLSLLNRPFQNIGFWSRLQYYFHHVAFVAAPLGVLLGVGALGGMYVLWRSWKKRREECGIREYAPLLQLGAWVFYVLFFHGLGAFPLNQPLWYEIYSRFWMQPDQYVCVAAGVGAFLGVMSLVRSEDGRARVGLPLTVIVGVGLVLRVLPVVYNAGNPIVDRYAKQLLFRSYKNATWIVSDDTQWTASRYLQACEGWRPDVTLVSGPMLSYKWTAHSIASTAPSLAFPGLFLSHDWAHPSRALGGPGATMSEIAANNLGRIPLFGTGTLGGGDDEASERIMSKWQTGLNQLFAPNDEEPRVSIPGVNVPDDDPRSIPTPWTKKRPFIGGYLRYAWRAAVAGVYEGEDELLLALPRAEDLYDFSEWGPFSWGTPRAADVGGGNRDPNATFAQLASESSLNRFQPATWIDGIKRILPLALLPTNHHRPLQKIDQHLNPTTIPDLDYANDVGSPAQSSSPFDFQDFPSYIKATPQECLQKQVYETSGSNPQNSRPLINEGSWEWRATVFARSRLRYRIKTLASAVGPFVSIVDRSFSDLSKWKNNSTTIAALDNPDDPAHQNVTQHLQVFQSELASMERLIIGACLIMAHDSELLISISTSTEQEAFLLRNVIPALHALYRIVSRSHRHDVFVSKAFPFHCLQNQSSPLPHSDWLSALHSILEQRVITLSKLEPDSPAVQHMVDVILN